MSKRKIYNITGTIATLLQACLMLMLIMPASTAYAAEKEQIKIEQLSLNRSVAYLGEEVIASVSVSAPTSLRKEVLRIRYYLDNREIGKQTITSFDPAGIANTEFTFKDSPEGRYQFRLIVDIEGHTAKPDEVTRQLAILSLPGGMTSQQFSANADDKDSKKDPASEKPDLEPVSIDFSIASPRLGQKVRIISRISNKGSVQADNVKIRLFINGQPYGDDITMNIAAGSQANIETDFQAVREGKKDVLVLINPDGEIDEKSNRNNLLSKTLIVRPAGKPAKKKKVTSAKKKSPAQADKANLVVYIETISGVHYTSNGQVQFYITNNSRSGQSKPFTLGVQLMQASQGKLWLIRQQVKALKAGETVTVSTKWPAELLSTTNLFLAMVDIEGKIEETDIRDNHTQPFRVVSTSTASPIQQKAAPVPKIIISRPANNVLLPDNNKLVITWETRGDTGKQVRITVSNSKTKEKILSSSTNNDGHYSIDFSTQKAGTYTLLISDNNSNVTSSKRTFKISRKQALSPPALVTPLSGSSFRGEQQMKVSWSDSIKNKAGLRLNLFLSESSSKKVIKLNDKTVAAADGKFTWQVPDDGTVFGIYRLQLISQAGSVLTETNGIELLPNFVSFDRALSQQGKDKIQTDLEIARTSFNGPNLEFLVMNNGPADISVSGMLGYRFTSYFVLRLPVTSDDDVVICQTSILAEMPQGEGHLISLGRDPDCPLGERGGAASFEYVVNRFVLPVLVDYQLTDPKPFNNLSKYYWPG
jgi:hypothetical protein